MKTNNIFLNTTLLIILIFFSSVFVSHGQDLSYNGSNILQNLKRLNTLGSVLYVAAHPDDENTRLISYLANEKLYRTSYLSLTRGDGGQNLIGKEQSALLGIIRTQELLSARRIDNGEQYFSRAVDFGYSRNPEETLEKWGEDEILADVVWAIRKLKPDVIITRFPTDGGGGHGHHTASAILAEKAFKDAADKNKYPDQLKYVSVWQAKRILFNSFNFRSRSNDDFTGQIHVDVGGYNPLLGVSNGEISSLSRSQHKSQGFGVSISRGSRMEHFKRMAGDTSVNALFENINTSWSRVNNGEKIGVMIDNAIEIFDPNDPSSLLTLLVEIKQEIDKVENEYWKELKMTQVDELIIACSGLYLEVSANNKVSSRGDSLNLEIYAISRTSNNVNLKSVHIAQTETTIEEKLTLNEVGLYNWDLTVPISTQLSTPYWLIGETRSFPNRFEVSNQLLVGTAENRSSLLAEFHLNIEGASINYSVPVTYKDVDPVKGEIVQPLAILPEVVVKIEEDSYLFISNGEKKIGVSVTAFKDVSDLKIRVNIPENWQCKPEFIDINSLKSNTPETFEFTITPPSNFLKNGNKQFIDVEILKGEKSYNQSLTKIEYDHIFPQLYLFAAKSELIPIDLKGNDMHIGYIDGAGDKVAESLQKVGFTITKLNEADIISGAINNYKTVITGIRAYNKHEWLMNRHSELMKYVENGGNYIVQYNTSNFLGSLNQDIGPYPFKITRNRVTVEETEPAFTDKTHRVFNQPNKLSESDFNSWVQERGLYFAGEIDSRYTTFITWNDPGYDPSEGCLISCKYGKGTFTYTGISFFRQLPANVPGSFRLLTNIINMNDNE